MRRTEALRRTLESLTRVYNDGGRVSVDFGQPSRAVHENKVVISPNVRDELGRNLSGPQELRCIANTLSHEIEHIRESDLTSKEEFMDEYPDHRQFAGAVINILEDQYIDYQRTQRYPGLRSAQAFVVNALMQNHHRRPRVDNIDHKVKRIQETLTQVAFAGYAKGISEADDDLREFAARVRPLIREVRREDDQEARKDISHAVMDISLEYLPDDEDVGLPDECVVCEEREPVVIVPLVGPVCERCAPSGHGTADGTGGGERPDDIDVTDRRGGGPQGEGDGGGGGGDGEGAEAGDGEGRGGDGDPQGEGDGEGRGGAGGRGDGDGPGTQSPISDRDDDDRIDPTEWDWLDLGDHSGHTVSIVEDDAEV